MKKVRKIQIAKSVEILSVADPVAFFPIPARRKSGKAYLDTAPLRGMVTSQPHPHPAPGAFL